jgi:prophage antirepressor-like protein
MKNLKPVKIPEASHRAIKIENWVGHEVRFIWIDDKKEWYAILKDVCDALDLVNVGMVIKRLDEGDITTSDVSDVNNHNQKMACINEIALYDVIFQSRKPEAKEFKRWVLDIIKTLREATGLEGWQAFRMMDKEHQKEAMRQLQARLKEPVKVDYIKANTIANKAVSNKLGYPKMLKKGDMPPKMLAERESILDNVVELMSLNEKYNLGLSVSERIYSKYANA